MKHDDFKIGGEFTSTDDGKRRWRCTDIGTRVIVAIRLDYTGVSTDTGGKTKHRALDQAQAEAEGWFNGPPYAVAEVVFDEDSQEACQPCKEPQR